MRLPLSAYTSTKVENTVVLCSRIVATNLLPAGWVLAENNIHLDSNSSPLPLVLYRPVEKGVLVACTRVTCSLTVDDNLRWTVRVGQTEITSSSCVLLKDFLPCIGSVDHLLQLLELVSSSSYCIGNCDPKFHELLDRHKGVFKDSTEKKKQTKIALFRFDVFLMCLCRYKNCCFL